MSTAPPGRIIIDPQRRFPAGATPNAPVRGLEPLRCVKRSSYRRRIVVGAHASKTANLFNLSLRSSAHRWTGHWRNLTVHGPMATTARITQYARWLEEMASRFIAMVILTETGDDYRDRDMLDQGARRHDGLPLLYPNGRRGVAVRLVRSLRLP